MSKTYNRRDFLKQAAVAGVAGTTGVLVGGCSIGESAATPAPAAPTEAPAEEAATQAEATEEVVQEVNVNTNQTIEWKVVMSWPITLPVFAEGVQKFAEDIDTMSQGRLKVQVFGAGELVGGLEVFDAVDAGTAEMGHTAAYYWGGKLPATQFFTSVPFGMNAQQMYGWLFAGGGMELWEEVYKDNNILPLPCGNSGIQMGGWFNKEINSLSDYEGLKMRIPGMGGKTIAKVGGSAELIAGGEIYTSLERGVIDATEWVGPLHDSVMGFHKVAQYYYYPGWHEPGSVLELQVNRQAFEALPADLQLIVRDAAMTQNTWMLAQFEGRNNQALQQLVNEEGVDLRQFPDEVMEGLRAAAEEVIVEIADSDAISKKVFESFRSFQEGAAEYGNISERAYYNLVQRPTA